MPADRASDPVEFAAPLGGRVKFITGLCFALGGGLFVFDLAFAAYMGPSHPVFVPMLIAAPLALAVFLLLAAHFRIRTYRVTADELQIVRRWRTDRLPLRGLAAATPDPVVLQGARKTMAGNDGLGAMTGRFRSRSNDEFEVFVSDPRRSVLLRWPERAVVVSPDRTAEFPELVLRRARQRR